MGWSGREARPRPTVQHPSDTRLSSELDTLREALERERNRADQAENRADAAVSRADAADEDAWDHDGAPSHLRRIG
jgi:hypothetical protein